MWLDRRLPPLSECKSVRAALPRGLLAALFLWTGVFVGKDYAHLCEAGSRWIEGGAIFGAPLAAAAWVSYGRRLWPACLGAALLLFAVDALREPYLVWAHKGMRLW